MSAVELRRRLRNFGDTSLLLKVATAKASR
jgi:hypothetical protein